MDLASILAAAEAAEHDNSQALFLIAGGILAAFAVIVSAVGIARPTWGGAAMNPIMGVGTVLAVGTMVAIVVVS